MDSERNVRKIIIETIEDSLGIRFNEDVNFQYSLLDPRVGMKPRDLLTVFFSLQNKFDIEFDKNDIVNQRFDFLENIVKSVCEKCDRL